MSYKITLTIESSNEGELVHAMRSIGYQRIKLEETTTAPAAATALDNRSMQAREAAHPLPSREQPKTVQSEREPGADDDDPEPTTAVAALKAARYEEAKTVKEVVGLLAQDLNVMAEPVGRRLDLLVAGFTGLQDLGIAVTKKVVPATVRARVEASAEVIGLLR